MTDYLVCKICGYKQRDLVTVQVYRERNPDTPEHDIYYICGACQELEEELKEE